jgi:hypothetical protein
MFGRLRATLWSSSGRTRAIAEADSGGVVGLTRAAPGGHTPVCSAESYFGQEQDSSKMESPACPGTGRDLSGTPCALRKCAESLAAFLAHGTRSATALWPPSHRRTSHGALTKRSFTILSARTSNAQLRIRAIMRRAPLCGARVRVR